MKSLFFLIILVLNTAQADTILLPNSNVKINTNSTFTDVDFKKYIDFAVAWSNYSYAGQPLPTIKFEKASMVEIYAYGEHTVAQAEHNHKKLPKVLAIYDRNKKTIYISNEVKINDPVLEITLVHETVHYLQDINGYTESLGEHLICTESEAYDIQLLWQLEYNVDEKSIPFVQERSLYSAMKCMGNQFKFK
jgi:hypothetical protein